MPRPHATYDLPRLRAALSPFRLHYFPTLRSTNTHAAGMRRDDRLFTPAVILTPRQTAGRGRGANAWSSPPGNLTVTFALPVSEHIPPHQLPLLAGLAVRNAVAELLHDARLPLLKWPNDLVVPTPYSELHTRNAPLKKLAGLLCERVNHVDLIGLGLNVNLEPAKAPKPLRHRLTSLRALANHPFDLTEVLLTVARHLRQTLLARDSRPFPSFLEEYDRHHALVGRTLTVTTSPDDPPMTGTCTGLDSTGRLLLKDRTATHAIIAGHVELR